MKFDVVDFDGKKVSEIDLADSVFGAEPNESLIYEVAKFQAINRRAGTLGVKNSSLVSGGGKKPWKQKGTGRARQGSIRATQWKGGGKPFGPTPRSYDKRMPSEMRRAALREALAARIAAGGLAVVEQLGLTEPRTKALTTRLRALGIEPAPTLLVVSERSPMLILAARNVPWLEVETPHHTSVYQVMRNGRVVFEQAALLALEEALRS